MVTTSGRSRRVVVTGASGSIGQTVIAHLSARWDVHATDLVPSAGTTFLDVTDAHSCRTAFRGADAVVHLAAVPDPDAGWLQLHGPNVVGAHHVARAAMDCGIRRLVLASSLQAVSADLAHRPSRPDDPPRPANLYGATKAWTEALGAWVATSSSTSVVALRIGYFAATAPTTGAQERSAWLSPRDCAELVRAAVEATDVTFAVANGISANRHRIADMTDTTRQLGYHPTDDAWAEH